jgi:ferredoxin
MDNDDKSDDDESDDDFPSLGELSRAALRSKISTEASKTASTPRLEQPAYHRTGPQVDRIQSGWGERQDRSRGWCTGCTLCPEARPANLYTDLPVIVDENDPVEAGAENGVEAVSGDINTGHIALDTSLHDTAISELSAPAESIDASGSWYDVEEGCFTEEPAQRLGSHEQYSVPSAPAQAQPQILPQSSQPLQDQIGP